MKTNKVKCYCTKWGVINGGDDDSDPMMQNRGDFGSHWDHCSGHHDSESDFDGGNRNPHNRDQFVTDIEGSPDSWCQPSVTWRKLMRGGAMVIEQLVIQQLGSKGHNKGRFMSSASEQLRVSQETLRAHIAETVALS
uniref:Uncharacterized protein n=1 Tax=Romanomermis culicivorax TaxID=13658 RepID=A0A915KA08_ROMCU